MTPPLIAQLQQKVRLFLQKFSARRDEVIYAPLARNLFAAQQEKLSVYLAEVEQTLAQLEQIDTQDQAALTFYSQKILAQCTALNEVLSRPQWKPNAPVQTSTYSPATTRTNPVHQLPARERLEKYYGYLQQFNQLIEQQQDLQRTSQEPSEQARCADKIARLQQRRAKCLESIETLEEYLAFKQQQEEKA